VAVIRPAALRNNLDRVRSFAPGCPILAVVKANAYGHGLIEVAQLLDGVDALAVARLEEAAQLRAAGIAKRIVVLGGCLSREEVQFAARLGLDLVIHSRDHLDLLDGTHLPEPVRAWLKVDTGMGRLGLPPGEVPEALGRLRASRSIGGLTLMTHLGCADDRSDPATSEQIRSFAALLENWAGDISIANSAAILQWPETVQSTPALRYTGVNWVRPGLMLFGASPLRGTSAVELGLKPVMSFETRLLAVKRVPAGQRVGYGGHWVAPRDSLIGIAAAGYADGYPWHAGAGTPVRVRGHNAPLVGRVSMDMITLDVTEVPGARLGDPVVLWGDGPTVEEVAAAARTIPWTLMTGINRRVAVRVET